MIKVLLALHLVLAIGLVGSVLLQRSEGGGLGIGGGGGGGLMTSRGSANLLTRTTAILAGLFMITSLAMAIMTTGASKPKSILDQQAPAAQEAPAQPAQPSVPLAR